MFVVPLEMLDLSRKSTARPFVSIYSALLLLGIDLYRSGDRSLEKREQQPECCKDYIP